MEKRVLDPFLTHFSSQNGPLSRHFGIFHGPKRATMGSKRAKNTCLSIPSGLGTTSEKMIFFALVTLVDPPLAPTVRGPGCPPAAPSDHRYGGLGVSLGDSEGWKPQKVGGCRRTRCPRNLVLSHVAQDTARSWFRGVWCTLHRFWGFLAPFWAVSRTYRGARGQKGALCHGAIEAHVECSNRLPSFRRFDWVSGPYWAKKVCLGAQNAQFWEGTSRLGAPAPGRHW